MFNYLKGWVFLIASFATLPAWANAVPVPEIDGPVALQMLVFAGGIVLLLKNKKKK